MICKVCKRYFKLKKENRYTIKMPNGVTITHRNLIEDKRTIECFDCPRCGCQNIVNIREEE